MRDILFRGRRSDGVWVFGYYFARPILGQYFIINGEEQWMVDPETVGQYTGLTDKNGKKIFEGDIVRIKDFTHGCALNYEQPTSKWVVHWREDTARFCIDYMTVFPFDFTKSEIVGNTHDTPELI